MIARTLARDLATRLTDAGIPDASLEAELITRRAGNLTRAQYFAGARLDAAQEGRARSLFERRMQREPAAYIAGYREFYGRQFRVTPDVLIPRPETELAVDVVLAELRHTPGALVADIGTGSGCIGTTIALERAGGTTLGIDLSYSALVVARENAAALNAPIDFLAADLASGLAQADVIVANLPYIPTGEVSRLQPEIRNWEPGVALDGGPDGLSLIRRLVEECGQRLRPSLIALEVGAGQAASALALFASQGAVELRAHQDLAGIERVVTARWQ